MVELVDLYIVVLSATTLLSLAVAVLAWRQRAVREAWPVVVMMLGVSMWAGSEAVLWSRTSFEQQVLWLNLTFPGTSVVLAGFVIFALAITGLRAWQSARRILLVTVPLTLVGAMAMANPAGLVSSGYVAQRIGTRIHYVAQNGPLFWVYILVTYGMFLASVALIARARVEATVQKRAQTSIILVAALFPFGVSALNQISPTPVEGIESAAFLVTGLILVSALIRGQLLDPEGNLVRAQDVAEAEQREATLQTANRDLENRLETTELYAALTELMPDFVFAIDRNMRVELANSAAVRFLGRPKEDVVGARVAELFGPVGAQFEEHLSQVAAAAQPLEFETRLSAPPRDEVWLKTSLVPLESGSVLGVSRDVTHSKHLEATLRERAEEEERLATHDPLTGLGNRRAFMVNLDRALALARRGMSSTVLFVDIDHFKRCNDERGHSFGDEVLTSVATLLAKEVREVDFVARVGGDEFGVLLAGSDAEGAVVVANRMSAAVEALGAEIGMPIGLSVGIAEAAADSAAVHVVSIADQRMYEHKATNHRHLESTQAV
jgi:diguanylate cyclase (GGDEF)-like protein/PAS domain S-box-containing protein